MANKIDLRALPPLKALKGFEAATRHQSIRNAADELCLTHPAVCHQVQLVEEALGIVRIHGWLFRHGKLASPIIASL